MEPVKIVVRYLGGQLLKGYSQNFFPNKPSFHVTPLDAEKSREPVEVYVSQLKSVFFVRDFVGNRAYVENKRIAEGAKPQGRMIEVTYRDGEVLVGTTTGYDPKRSGFFVFPVDRQVNNVKIYVVSAAVAKVRFP